MAWFMRVDSRSSIPSSSLSFVSAMYSRFCLSSSISFWMAVILVQAAFTSSRMWE